MIPLEPMIRSLRSFWNRGPRVERVGYVVGALLLMSGLTHLGILALSGGSWEGPLSLRQPAVFGLSFGLTLTTIVWTASFLPLGGRTRGLLLSAFTDWSERRRIRMVQAASVGYIVLAAVVAGGNFVSLDRGQLPLLAEARAAIAALAILSIGAMALLGVARAPSARGLEHS